MFELFAKMAGGLAKKRKSVGKIISIEEARAAARAARRRAGVCKSNANVPSISKVNKFERWLKETYSEISKNKF